MSNQYRTSPLVVLIGSKPAEGYQTLARLGIPYIWVVDPVDGPLPEAEGFVEVLEVPFKSEPEALLSRVVPAGVQAVVSFTEMGSLPAALLSEALGLPTVPVRAVVRARHKLLMRRVLAADPDALAFGVVGSDDPAGTDFPVIVKPADGTGSMGVEYVADAATYRDRFAALTGAMWEHYIGGTEYSVEAVSSGGRHRILGITAKQTTGKPYFVETGHEVPAPLTPEEDQAIRAGVLRCLDALEITAGGSHTEVKVENGRAVVIETHTRPGGDRIPLLTRLVGGADQYEHAIRSLLPQIGTSDEAPRHKHAAVHYFPWQGVTVDGVDNLEQCRSMPGVEELVVQVADGSAVPVWRYSHERPGHVVVGADDREELRRRLAAVEQAIRPRLS
ncbi:ATP-grasp domain-containing protein [Actinoplanes sp. NPDC051475]|uniref:ATP-grasp domain-containing protein n=1 Tax=Actinoplanes sp. NPDC051475 TaxID=3157225 RepID=UPI00345103CE